MKKKIAPFTADQFTPSKFASAEEKAKFANDLAGFILAGFPPEKWTKSLYKRLSLTFGHIAHYDAGGFWYAQFETAEKRACFLEETIRYPCYGSPDFTFSDVEKAIIKWLKAENLAPKFRRLANAAHEQVGMLESRLTEEVRELSKAIYLTLEKEYDSLVSEEAVKDTIEANEYLFLENGRLEPSEIDE